MACGRGVAKPSQYSIQLPNVTRNHMCDDPYREGSWLWFPSIEALTMLEGLNSFGYVNDWRVRLMLL